MHDSTGRTVIAYNQARVWREDINKNTSIRIANDITTNYQGSPNNVCLLITYQLFFYFSLIIIFFAIPCNSTTDKLRKQYTKKKKEERKEKSEPFQLFVTIQPMSQHKISLTITK